MLKRIRFFVLLACLPFSLFAEGKQSSEKKSAYRYIVDNYFSRRPNNSYINRSFSLSSGISFYRMNSEKETKNPFSIYSLSFTQNAHTFPSLGDLHLRASVVSSRMKRGRALFLELTPLFLFPELQTRFPIYLGLGLGLGFSPFYLIDGKSSFSLHAPFLLGLRFFNLYYNVGLGGEMSLRVHYPFHEMEFNIAGLGRIYLIFNF